MRIISKFHDYYDTALSYGIDTTLIYDRQTVEIDLKEDVPNEIYKLLRMHNNSYGRKFNTELYVVGFCGTFYPVYRLVDTNSTPVIKDFTRFVYSSDDVVAFLTDMKLSDALVTFNKTQKARDLKYSFRSIFSKQIFERNIAKSHTSDELFHKYKTPIMLFKTTDGYRRKTTLVLNPQLKDYDFFRKFDAFTSFQNISMYLGGVIGNNEDAIVNVSDKDMRDAKGFDDWSFKTLPTKHKK